MSDSTLVDRFEAAYAAFSEVLVHPSDLSRTAPDPETGEQWDRAHVLGHVSEMLEYWMAEVLRVLAHGPDEPFGRLKQSTDRIGRIERSAQRSLQELAAEIELRAQATIDLCRILQPHQREQRGLHPKFGLMSVEEILVEFGADHLLEHAQQLGWVDRSGSSSS